MRFDDGTHKQKAIDLRIKKLSVCVTPAHEGALATIIKEAAITENDVEIIDDNLEGETEMTEEQIAKMIADAVGPIQKKLDIAEAVAKMDDKTKAHYGTLNENDKTEFLKMSKDDRDALMGDDEIVVEKVIDDETFTSNGTTIAKSVVGEDVFNLMKSQQADIKKANDLATVEKEKRELQEFIKFAETHYPHLPGKPIAKGMVMKSIASMPKEVGDTLSTMLKLGNEAVVGAKLFKEIGSDGIPVDEGSPLAKLKTMSIEKAKADGTSEAVAYSALLNTDEGQTLYQQAKAL